MEYYNKSLQIAQQYPSLLPYLFDGMGDCFKRQGETVQALAYFTQALQVLQGLGLGTSQKAIEIAEKVKDLT
jgi:hypothetical protein